MIKFLRTLFFASLTALLTFVALPLPFAVFGPLHLPGAEVLGAWGGWQVGFYHASGQLLALALAATLLPPVGAFMSQAVYLGAGLAGMPVFAGGGGWAYTGTPGFSYLVMLPLGAWLAARVARPGGVRLRWLSLMLGLMLVMGSGTMVALAHAGGLGSWSAWVSYWAPTLQALPAGLLVTLPLALLGGLGDRLRAPLPRVEVGPQSADRAATQPLPERPALPGPPERAALPGAPSRKALEGPPPRKAIEGPPRRLPLSDGPTAEN